MRAGGTRGDATGSPHRRRRRSSGRRLAELGISGRDGGGGGKRVSVGRREPPAAPNPRGCGGLGQASRGVLVRAGLCVPPPPRAAQTDRTASSGTEVAAAAASSSGAFGGAEAPAEAGAVFGKADGRRAAPTSTHLRRSVWWTPSPGEGRSGSRSTHSSGCGRLRCRWGCGPGLGSPGSACGAAGTRGKNRWRRTGLGGGTGSVSHPSGFN